MSGRATTAGLPRARPDAGRLVDGVRMRRRHNRFRGPGAFHRDLARELPGQGPTFARVDPRQARRSAEAIGRAAKNRLGGCRSARQAGVTARKGGAMHLAPIGALPEHEAGRQDLLVLSRALFKGHRAVRTRLKTVRQPLLRRRLNPRLSPDQTADDRSGQPHANPKSEPCPVSITTSVHNSTAVQFNQTANAPFDGISRNYKENNPQVPIPSKTLPDWIAAVIRARDFPATGVLARW